MLEKLRQSLINYYMTSFDMTEPDAAADIDDNEQGLAYTNLDEEQEDGTILEEAHEMEVILIVSDKMIVYEIDGEPVGEETFESEEEIANYLDTMSFEAFYSATLNEYAPENYY